MIRISDIPALIPIEILAGLDPEITHRIILDIADASRAEWIRLASGDNKVGSHWRYDYINGIQEVVEESPGTAVIALVGEIPHMLEDGAEEQDLRETLLGPGVPEAPVGSRGKHRSLNDRFYRAIPLRHMTPGTEDAPRGRTHGRGMDQPYSGSMAAADAAKLGRDVYSAARKLEVTVSAPKGGTVYGGRLKPGTGGAVPLANPATGTPHKTDIYAGMIREEKTYEKVAQHQYATFRTISTGVQDGSWIRRAIPARHYAEKVAAYAVRLAPRVIEKLMEAKK